MKNVHNLLTVFLGIAMVISGIYCIATPELTFLVIGWIVGVNMVVDSIGNIIMWIYRKKSGLADGWTLAGAVLSLGFGIVLLVSDILQFSMDLFIAYMAALWILITGILRLVHSSHLHHIHKELNTQIIAKNWWIVMVNGIILIGVLSLMNPVIIAVTIGTLIGINILFAGVNLIVTGCAA